MLNINAVTIGMVKLSLNLGEENNSVTVAANVAIRFTKNNAGENKYIINDAERKKCSGSFQGIY